jgi:hypothetical protein
MNFLLQQWFTILWHELMANVHFVQQLQVFTTLTFKTIFYEAILTWLPSTLSLLLLAIKIFMMVNFFHI